MEVNVSLARFALSPSSENSYLVYSDTVDNGMLIIFNTIDCKTIKSIEAHKSPIMKVSINGEGSMIATSSCKVFLVVLKSREHL
jgi:hypothetical protein